MKKILFLILICLMFYSCADVENVEKCVIDYPYGFWGGLWHGIIAPFSFIGRLFSDDIAIYAINNNGRFYDFGFVLGLSCIFGSGSSSVK